MREPPDAARLLDNVLIMRGHSATRGADGGHSSKNYVRQRDSPFVSFSEKLCGDGLRGLLGDPIAGALGVKALDCEGVLLVLARTRLEQRGNTPRQKAREKGDGRSDEQRDENGALGLLARYFVLGTRVRSVLLAGMVSWPFYPDLLGNRALRGLLGQWDAAGSSRAGPRAGPRAEPRAGLRAGPRTRPPTENYARLSLALCGPAVLRSPLSAVRNSVVRQRQPYTPYRCTRGTSNAAWSFRLRIICRSVG